MFLQIKATENAQTALRPLIGTMAFLTHWSDVRALEAFQAKPHLNLRLNRGRSLSD
jgi:hypothetical protein